MKKSNYFLMMACSLFSVSAIFAQKDSSGIFKTESDYKEGKLSYAINYRTEKHKIKDNMLFNNDDVKIVHENKTYVFKKKDTYGYRSTHGEDFRFVDNKSYKILNPGGALTMYEFVHPAPYPKESGKYPPTYFFSTDAASATQPLTKENLKAAFPDNHKFHDAIDATFKNDEGLASYDNFHKMYKVDHLLKSCMK